MVREETICPPSGRICSREQAIAAIPLATPSAASIPSMAASFFPKAATVGLAWRLYRYLPDRVPRKALSMSAGSRKVLVAATSMTGTTPPSSPKCCTSRMACSTSSITPSFPRTSSVTATRKFRFAGKAPPGSANPACGAGNRDEG